jgi:outer membrane protein assembly factor BamB
VMMCRDAESGRIIWRRRIGSGPGAFYASLVAADGKVYAVRSNGTTYVIAAEDTFRLVSESPLAEEVFASPAFAAGCLLLRTASALYCIANED